VLGIRAHYLVEKALHLALEALLLRHGGRVLVGVPDHLDLEVALASDAADKCQNRPGVCDGPSGRCVWALKPIPGCTRPA
jgi:hypothetical protein